MINRRLSEKELTKRYISTLNEIRKEKGILASVEYDIKSGLYSIGRTISNLFDRSPAKFYNIIADEAEYIASQTSDRKRRKELDKLADKWRDEALRLGANAETRRKIRTYERQDFLLKGEKRHDRERREAAITAAISCLLGGIFFILPNITGNAIVDSTLTTSSTLVPAIFGCVLLVVGFLLLVLKRKK